MSTTTRYSSVTPYTTKDGSQIRELMNPQQHGSRAQSLAEATIFMGKSTTLHLHRETEEIYHVVGGRGIMTLGEERFPIARGDTILIPPGTPHCVSTVGTIPLRILCQCSPAYAHEDTVLLETHQHEVQAGDIYLMCSDGLSDMLDDNSIGQVLQAHDSLEAGCRALIEAANDAGGKDNISVVLVRASGGATSPNRFWWPFRR